MDEHFETLINTFNFKAGGRSASLLARFLGHMNQTEGQRLAPCSGWSEPCLWMNEQAKRKDFRLRWRRLSELYPKLGQVVFVRIASRRGVSPGPHVTWNWADRARSRAILAEEA